MSQARLQLDCRGVVQGVGFRPLVHRLATELQLVGEVENVAGAVRLLLQGERLQLEQLVRRLPLALHPPGSLEPLEPRWLPPLSPAPRGLRLAAAAPQPLGAGLIAAALVPDLAPCPACLDELRDPANRRYRYPFISCCHCGPRYSIATAEPYARAHTTMAAFALCADCRREFEDPLDRRFHAETIACPRCGPRLRWRDRRGAASPADDPLRQAVALLQRGGIVALMGVGGVQLLVDATDAEAVARLRRRKRRPHKPLALLVAHPDQLDPWLWISPAERALLLGPEAPIVLLQRRVSASCTPLPPLLAPGSNELGVMLPASPVHHLLAVEMGRPLVATSGNRSGEPLCYRIDEAMQQLGDPMAPIADGWLLHDRAVARPLDDSVLRCIASRPVLLRRARGYAPAALKVSGLGALVPPALALGGDLKSAPALALAGRVWLAPHLGDLADGRTQTRWSEGLAELLQRHGDQLEAICSDQHPGYQSEAWARRCSRRHPQLRHLRVQHHQAHGLAVLAEHGRRPPALVLAFDGLGHGAGPAPWWGGEGLWLDDQGRCRRRVCLRPFPLPGGVRAAREPRRAALGLLWELGPWALTHPGAAATRAAFGTHELALLQQALASGCQCPRSSSAGRLFDAVASLLDLVQRLSYEGQGGLLLQGAAESWRLQDSAAAIAQGADRAAWPLPLQVAPAWAGVPQWWDWDPLLRTLLKARAAGASASVCALAVHRAWIAAVLAWVHGEAVSAPVVLAGGCFQNRLLLEGLIEALTDAGYEPLWAEQLPSGDGGLALGQLLALQIEARPAAGANGARPAP